MIQLDYRHMVSEMLIQEEPSWQKQSSRLELKYMAEQKRGRGVVRIFNDFNEQECSHSSKCPRWGKFYWFYGISLILCSQLQEGRHTLVS